uniref:Uncharacterized protein n=1 Tax=Anguilla anguilla TaxID=7936 RepID=A0A0E9T658_ANGAN
MRCFDLLPIAIISEDHKPASENK